MFGQHVVYPNDLTHAAPECVPKGEGGGGWVVRETALQSNSKYFKYESNREFFL